jgi:hypothetical protein
MRGKRGGWDDDEDFLEKINSIKNSAISATEGVKNTMTKAKMYGILTAILLVIGLILGSMLIGSNKAGWILVKQAAWTGDLTAIFKEGVYARMLGDIEPYPLTSHFYFSKYKDEGTDKDESVPVTFRNGSVGQVSGNLRYAYPLSQDPMLGLHRRYHNDRAVRLDLVRTTTRNLIGMTASLMSPEAAMTQKGLYYQMLQDQIENGQYQTVAAKETFTDPITKEVTIRDVVEIDRDPTTKQPRRLENPFKSWGIKIDQLVIQDIMPDQVTMAMIGKRRDAEMTIMVAKADVEKANQEKLKVQAEGAKSVAEKEYAALMEKKTATVAAEKEKEVAALKANQEKEVATIAAQRQVEVNQKAFEAAEWDKKTAEQIKLAAIERGKGEAEARKLAMEADGALKLKLETYERVMKNGYDAFAHRNVPQIVMGGAQGGASDDAALQFMQMLSMKAAKDLALDMGMDAAPKKK